MKMWMAASHGIDCCVSVGFWGVFTCNKSSRCPRLAVQARASRSPAATRAPRVRAACCVCVGSDLTGGCCTHAVSLECSANRTASCVSRETHEPLEDACRRACHDPLLAARSPADAPTPHINVDPIRQNVACERSGGCNCGQVELAWHGMTLNGMTLHSLAMWHGMAWLGSGMARHGTGRGGSRVNIEPELG